MTTFDVGVWISGAQYTDTGYTVRDKVETYLDNCDDDISHSINAVAKSQISTPVEDPTASFTTMDPCNSSYDITYDNMHQWWKDYTVCNNLSLESDANLIVTDNSGTCGGGIGGGSRAVANGNWIENLPSYTNYDNGCAAYSMSAPIHEVGHCLIGSVSDSDGDGYGAHDTCDNRYHGGDQYTTPMGVGYHDPGELDGSNECGQTVVDPTGGKYIDFNFDDCAGSHM